MREFQFISGSIGPLCVMHWLGKPDATPVLLLAPLQEELNKSRYQLNRIAQHLQSKGHAVLLGDYSGTGDSAGDWQDARLSLWQQDVQLWLHYLAQRYSAPAHIVSLRAGALCIPNDFSGARTLCFPVLNGKAVVTQWIRQKLFASRLAGGNDSTASLTETWRDRGLELGGYFNHPDLLAELELAQANAESSSTHIIELSNNNEPTPAIKSFCERSHASWAPVSGEAFWQATEIGFIATLPQAIAMSLPS